MRRSALALVVTVLATTLLGGVPRSAFGAAGDAKIDPVLAGQLATAGAHDMVEAVVVLRSQADLASVRASHRAQRRVAVVQTLRAKAATSQKDLLGLLATRRAAGLVHAVTPLWVENAVAVTATPAVLKQLARRPEVGELQADLHVQAPDVQATTGTPEPNLSVVNAPALWSRGFTGQGVVVASMDTGVDASHPDLASRWRGGSNSWYDPYGQHPSTPTDVNGHGTQTMGVMVGGDAGGSTLGMAPDARWIAVKMFNDRGQATSTGIHLGFQWLLDPDGNPSTADAPDVVNNSWTLSTASCTLDFQPDLQSLRSAGIVPVFSAGNYGPLAGTVYSPANNPEALAVGATDNADGLYTYSSRGPSSCAGSLAPDLVAPGVNIRSSDLYGGYVQATGTSLAAPHVAGALALLLDAFPDLTADQQEAAMENAAVDLGPAGVDGSYGYGRIDVNAAYERLASNPDFGVTVQPQSATVQQGGTVTYAVTVTGSNGFGGDVALSLAGLTGDQAGWSFEPPVVSGGSGTSQLTVSTAAAIPPGSYPLSISGTSGSMTRTAAATLVIPNPPDFGLAVTPSTASVPAGVATSYTATVTALNGFTGDVALGLSGLPSSVGSAAFNPATVAGAGNATLSVTTLATAAPGTYNLTVTATSGSLAHTFPVTLVVQPSPDFGLVASPASVTVSRGGSAVYTLSASALGGFVGKVSLAVTGLPAHSSSTFSVNPVTVPGKSKLTVKTTTKTARGTYLLTVKGTSGSKVHQVTVTLVVR